MNRCLHITINDGAAAVPQHATANVPGWAESDPGSANVMAPPEDPGSANIMAPPENPDQTGYFSSAPAAAAPVCGCTAVAAREACSCAAPAGCQPATGAATLPSFVAPRDLSGFVIVRMAQGVEHPTARSLWKLAKELGLTGLRAALELPPEAGESDEERRTGKRRHLVSRPLVELQGEADGCWGPLSREDCIKQIHDLEKKASTTAFPPLHSLTSYWRVDLRKHPDLVEAVVARLNRLAEVDLAYRELTALDSEAAAANGTAFAEDQGYLEDAPLGIGASWAWDSLSSNSSPQVTLCDLEQGWNTNHQDLKGALLTMLPLYGANRATEENTPGHHGTAVLGQLVAAGGVQGAGLGRLVLASHYRSKDEEHFPGTNGHVAAAIVQALVPPGAGPLGEGDVLLLEVQRGLLPTEIDEADFDAIRLAVGQGVIVIEAAGNGGFDLDRYSDPETHRTLRRGDAGFRDSGAVLVGAARATLPHDRAPFSNYGSRLDCFAWGETVTTCGYGDLAGTGAVDFYTNQFSGTSSASPIIAGAAALLQALHQAHAGVKLGPSAMRALLSDPATGTPQGPNVPGRIGVMPNLKAIVRERLQLVPDVYLRRSLCDDGSPRGPRDEVSSSPDILVWPGGLTGTPGIGEARQRFGEGALRENLPAPGGSLDATLANEVYVRLRNRGLGVGEVHVELFASPAATLITSERWIPLGSLDVTTTSHGGVPQGDTLFVAGPIQVPPNQLTSPLQNTPWSFLAILSRPGKNSYQVPHHAWAVGLPPGPPYFDWAVYRDFLRRPGVAWRNTHRVNPGLAVDLPFCIAGTPDRAREFDFEIVQRLPAKAQVILGAPPALLAKLRQRQPWLPGTPTDVTLSHRPRTTFSRVQLAASTCADATFRVTAGPNSPLGPGHSLAIRQLWRGEEVGRVTWYFTLD